jgi:serine/threonine protein kinase
MGAVYEAIDQRLDTTVALKETLFTDEKLRRQFEREARLLARLHHPALPRVSDHFAEADGAFLVMQYIAGDDLAEMINLRRGTFPLEQVLLWADQLLDALDYLHTQDPQIIHRDIKPQNLKLSSRGQIILLDFGLAKGQLGEVSRVSTASIFGYTPNYAPLEQIQGLGTDPRSDIYALAATLYHLLTGVKPPDALTRAAAIVNGQHDPLKAANEIASSIGPQVAAVLSRAMSQNREQRYTSAAAMRTALQTSNEVTVGGRDQAATVLFASPGSSPTKLAGGSTVPATMVSTGETTVVRRPERKGRGLSWAVAAGALVLLLCVGGAGFYFVSEQRKNAEATTQPSPSPIVTVAQPSASPHPSPEIQISGVNEKPKPAEPTKETGKQKADKDKQDREEARREENERRREEADRRRQEDRERREAEAEAEQERAQAEKDRIEKEKNKRKEPPEPPDDPGYIEVPGPNGSRRRIPTVRNKTLPDGTKVTVTPNGTRIVTFPDGSTRVIPPPGPRRRPRP